MFSFNPFSSIGNLKPYAILEDGKIPASQLPGYVDDVLEFADIHGLPVVGETGKIYVTIDSGKCWRWSGSAFIEISPTTAHKSTHATGGTDALAPADITASPLTHFFSLNQCPDGNFNTNYFFGGYQNNRPKYVAATGESVAYNSDEWVVETAEGVTKYFNLKNDPDPSTLTGGWKRIVGASALPVSLSINIYGAVPNTHALTDPVVQSATELRTQEDHGELALKYSVEEGTLGSADSWHVFDPNSFRAAIGAATAAQGAKADTSLQQGAYISAASLEVGSIAASQTADLYVGIDGKVGIGTETPTEKLTVSGHIDILGGRVKNLGTPVDDTDAASKGYADNLIPTPPTTGTYVLRAVSGVLQWQLLE